jgi:hypothetical protein
MKHSQPKLPVYRDAPAPPPVPPPFPLGAKVYLQGCQVGIPGIVSGHSRGRVHISWPGWNFTGKYRADRLIAAEEEGEINHEHQTQQAE